MARGGERCWCRVRLVCAVCCVLTGMFVASRLFALDVMAPLMGTERRTHGSQFCSSVGDLRGAEDVQVLGHYAYLTADPRDWVLRQHREHVGREESQRGVENGALYLMDLREEDAQPRRLEMVGGPRAFFPHGLFVYPVTGDPQGELLLAVVNHGAPETVDLFRTQAGSSSVQFVESVASPWVGQFNDVLLTSPTSFYVTLWIPYPDGSKMSSLASVLGLRGTFVAYCSKGPSGRWSCEKVIDGFLMANGLALSPDGKLLYVADSMAKGVYAYHRDSAAEADLKLWHFFRLGSAVDNINIAEDGSLWIGSHPSALQFFMFLKGWREAPGSLVVRLKIRAETDFTIEELLVADGDTFATSTSAAVYKDTFLVGSVFGKGLLRCRHMDMKKARSVIFING